MERREPKEQGRRTKDDHKIVRKNNCGKEAETISMDACNKALQIDHSASGCDFSRFPFADLPPPFSTFSALSASIFSPASFLALFWLFAQRILSQLQSFPRPKKKTKIKAEFLQLRLICIFNFMISGPAKQLGKKGYEREKTPKEGFSRGNQLLNSDCAVSFESCQLSWLPQCHMIDTTLPQAAHSGVSFDWIQFWPHKLCQTICGPETWAHQTFNDKH